ncbi:MAG: hypothetical protein ACK5RO_12315 [Pseudobdellovibrionaceae bacterium]|jgi:YbbR domain-containing protein
MRVKWKDVVTENLSYKLVSLFIALILWLTILGRRDFTLSKSIEVETYAVAGLMVQSQSTDVIKVKVTGPRNAIRKFIDSGLNQVLSVDVTNFGVGEFEVEIPVHKIDVPFGVKVVSVRPQTLRVKIVKK